MGSWEKTLVPGLEQKEKIQRSNLGIILSVKEVFKDLRVMLQDTGASHRSNQIETILASKGILMYLIIKHTIKKNAR